MEDELKRLRDDLRLALERWREADYHWALEFGPVPRDHSQWTPIDDDFRRIDAELREHGV